MTQTPEEISVEALGGKLAAKGKNVSNIALIVGMGLLLAYVNYNGFNEIKMALAVNSTEHINLLRAGEVNMCVNYLERWKPEVLQKLSNDFTYGKLHLQCPWMTAFGMKGDH